jgi:sigma-B regulation protein RsbU (phosphoserine phosphatase)
MPTADYRMVEQTLAPGDTLVVYSDGYTEAENPDGEELGQDGLAGACIDNRQLAPGELAAAIDHALDDFTGGLAYPDDRTIVIVRRDG